MERLPRARPHFPSRDRRSRFNDRFAGCRLGKMGGKARLAAPLDVFFLPVAAQRNARELVSALAELPHQVVATAIGQTKIAHQQIELIAGRPVPMLWLRRWPTGPCGPLRSARFASSSP